MKHLLTIFAAILLAGALAARPAMATQEYILPTLFDVTDVAADDVLNIRAGPGTRFEVIGTLAPDATHIEVVAHDRSGQWGQVNTRERAGWVALRHLAYRVDVWEPGSLPAGFACFGTEPFWSMRPDRFATPEAPDTALETLAVLDSGVFRDPRRAVVATDGDRRLTLSATPQYCSDGMSDRAFGLGAMLVIDGADAPPTLLTGCCSIAP